MTVPAKLDIGRTLGGRYKLLEEIGEGGFGKIFRARQLNIERDVAIKVLPPQFSAMANVVQRFQREARLASRLRHPNTITIHDYGREEDFFFIAMEYLTGEDLADRLSRVTTLPLATVLHIGTQTLESLREAHAAGIIHRDLKPENIFLTPVGDDENFVKVLDFGIAKLATTTAADAIDDGGRSLTVQGNTVGTPAYMSPEQAAGESVAVSSDIYTLGIILYEMVNGRPPFLEDRPVRTMRAQLFDPVPAFSNKELRNTTFESVVRKALAKDPEHRFASVEEFQEALAQPDLDKTSFGFLRLGADPGHAFTPMASEDSAPRDALDTPVHARSTASHDAAPNLERSKSPDKIPFAAVENDLTDGNDAPPQGFSANQEGSITSSIITVLEPSEEDVIVLTKKKETPSAQDDGIPKLKSGESDQVEPDQSEWAWSEEIPATDTSGSQILTGFDPAARRRRIIALMALVAILVLTVLYSTGWLNLG